MLIKFFFEAQCFDFGLAFLQLMHVKIRGVTRSVTIFQNRFVACFFIALLCGQEYESIKAR